MRSSLGAGGGGGGERGRDVAGCSGDNSERDSVVVDLLKELKQAKVTLLVT
jgi:hypothetical protein